MLAVERQRRILDLVNEQGSVRVTEISERFDVTPETVRRDLDLLESDRKLQRSHGGAVRLADGHGDIPYLERESMNSREKSEVALAALKYIQPGDRIALDASSTAWYLARALPDIALTVLTNSVRVVVELSGKERIDVISTGGILRPTSMSFVGPLAEDALGKYHVNKAFLSCKGIHAVHGASESNELQALIKRRMVSIADKVFLLTDHTKFGIRDFAHAVDVHDLDIIITDTQVDADVVSAFQDLGIEVVNKSNEEKSSDD